MIPWVQFADSDYLNALWFLFPLIILFGFFINRRMKILERFSERKLLDQIAVNFSLRALKFKFLILWAVFALSILAVARPQWGYEWQEVKRQGVDIILVMDVSKSMLTQDVKPSRLERSKLAVQDLLKKLKGDRIGLIAFAGDAFLTCPLTVDYNGFLLSLNDLSVNTVPRGGTNVGHAIAEALKSYENVAGKYKAIIVITDGEELEGDAVALAKKAKEQGVKIYCIGVGTKEGELIQYTDENGQRQFLKDAQGNFVKSRLNEGLLEQIASITGGIYIKAAGVEFGLDLIYDQELGKIEKREFESKRERKYFDRFQIPLFLAFVLLLFETCLTTRKNLKSS